MKEDFQSRYFLYNR